MRPHDPQPSAAAPRSSPPLSLSLSERSASPPGRPRAEAEQQKAAYEQELAEQRARADEERTNLQGKLSELSEQLLTSMIEPVKREG